ncbi:mhyt domain signaling [Pyrenophora seminiperda CCB06]|uniref:Mhyt domain signaling n=1 Tax=Pyrenophora seminiperda CCB06 TaxID=1302712 RepID=A0A3M7LVJ1_9PLEO|nr:mhyt domain signaling [Pyrenophora seminiperda CCB06]
MQDLVEELAAISHNDITTKYPIGSRPRISFVPYIIFCSYLVSLIGSFTTVELLHRRVSGAGWRSLYVYIETISLFTCLTPLTKYLRVQIAGCAVSFGLVAIWCMHFVGNRAIVLGNGEKEIQLYYSPSYTAISAILPVVVIFLGLVTADRFYKGNKRAIARFGSLGICGICGGAAVTEMHYLGNYGTTNYRIVLNWSYVAGAALIAVGACLISFGLFFHWSQHWMNNIWRRIVVALFLAAAIRGYHSGPGKERNINLIISLCLCLSACVVCFMLGFIKQRQRRMERNRARQVVLAIATFDPEGRLLVSQGGLMPCQTITQQFHQRTFDEEFNTGHPVFQWIFRVSRNWSGVSELIPSMREHLKTTGYLQTTTPGGHSRGPAEDDGLSYSATFRELFCVTAQEIAKTLDMSLSNLGCLYEDVLTTGTVMSRVIWTGNYGNKTIMAADVAAKDLEAGVVNPILFGRGQMLVLTRKVNTTEAHRLQNLGYGFASIDQVSDHLARSLQIPRDDLEDLVGRLHAFSERQSVMPKKGTYLASFILQAKPGMGGLDIIVPRTSPGQLPMVKMSDDELDGQQLRTLSAFNGLSLDECLTRINQRLEMKTEDDVFLTKFFNSCNELLRDCAEETLLGATFSAQQLDMMHGQTESSQATVFAFCGIKEIYVQSLQSLTLKTIPLSFFQTHLRSLPACADHAILAQKNHKEFSSLQQIQSVTKSPTGMSNYKWPRYYKWPRMLRPKGSVSSIQSCKPDTCSEKGLVNVAAVPATSCSGRAWGGGIMVTSTQDMHVDESKGSGEIELRDLGVKAKIDSVAETEQPTLADRLMAITTEFRGPHVTRPSPSRHYHVIRK